MAELADATVLGAVTSVCRFKSCYSHHFVSWRMALLCHSPALLFSKNGICTLFVLYSENYAPNFKAFEIASDTIALDRSSI